MNRCTLLGGNGPVILSVPLDGGRNQKTIMKEVKILERDNWQDRHWKTITSCYNKAPWFDHYRDSLEHLYSQRFKYLVDWNVICFEWICDKMAITVNHSLSAKFLKDCDKNEFLDLRGQLMPASINNQFPDAQRYPQVFEDRFGFVPNLSVLDCLFCVGPDGIA